jgi:hypothetical protein
MKCTAHGAWRIASKTPKFHALRSALCALPFFPLPELQYPYQPKYNDQQQDQQAPYPPVMDFEFHLSSFRGLGETSPRLPRIADLSVAGRIR